MRDVISISGSSRGVLRSEEGRVWEQLSVWRSAPLSLRDRSIGNRGLTVDQTPHRHRRLAEGVWETGYCRNCRWPAGTRWVLRYRYSVGGYCGTAAGNSSAGVRPEFPYIGTPAEPAIQHSYVRRQDGHSSGTPVPRTSPVLVVGTTCIALTSYPAPQ